MAAPGQFLKLLLCCVVLSFFCTGVISVAQQQQQQSTVAKSHQLQVTFASAGTSDFRVDFLNATTGLPSGVYLTWSYIDLIEIDGAAAVQCNSDNNVRQQQRVAVRPPGFPTCPQGVKDSGGGTTLNKNGALDSAIAALFNAPQFQLVNQSANISVSNPGALRGVIESNSTFEATSYLMLENYTFPALGPDQPPVTIVKGGLKFNYAIKDWPFSQTAGALRQRVLIEVFPASAISVNTTDNVTAQIPSDTTTFTITHPDGTQAWTLQLATVCLSGSTTDDTLTVEDITTSASLNSTSGQLSLSLYFPPSSYIYYDPDIQSLFGGSSASSSDGTDNGGSTKSGSGGDGGDNNALIIATTVIIPIAGLTILLGFIVVVILAIWRVIHRYRRTRALTTTPMDHISL